jgi:hypothetical protein
MLQGLFGCFLSMARTAASNTSFKFSFFIALHSTNAEAFSFDFNFLASTVVTNFSELGIRKSLFVATNTIGTCGEK